MATIIIQSLRALAKKIETLGEEADEIIKKDEGLASDFRKLLKVVPATWRRDSENRLFKQVKKNTNHNDIRECNRKVIWSWKETHERFCLRQDRNTFNSCDTSGLDGLISGIESDDTDLVLSAVHWRISLLLIYLVKDRVCKDTADPEEIATCFQSTGLISTRKFDYFKNNVCRWADGGEKYNDLSVNLGGYGSLIYLPDIGRTNYEVHYFPTTQSAYAVIGALTPSIAPVAERKFDGFNGHNVVDAIVQGTIDRIKDLRLIIIPVRYTDTQQPKRTSRVEKNSFGNQSSQSRKRTNENGRGTPLSKMRRVDVRRAGAGAATIKTCCANTNNHNIRARRSEPSSEEVALALWNIRDGQPNLSVNEQSRITNRRTAHISSTEAEKSYSPSVSAASSTTSSTETAVTTADIDDGSETISSERTSVNSMSVNASHLGITGVAADCNSQFRPVHNDLVVGQVDLLPSTVHNSQVTSCVSAYQVSIPQNSGMQPAHCSRGIEPNQHYANYIHLSVEAPEHQPGNEIGTDGLVNYAQATSEYNAQSFSANQTTVGSAGSVPFEKDIPVANSVPNPQSCYGISGSEQPLAYNEILGRRELEFSRSNTPIASQDPRWANFESFEFDQNFQEEVLAGLEDFDFPLPTTE